MKISPHQHCESPLTGSTIANMISKAKALGRTHFAITDHGHLSSVLKTYGMAKKAGLKFVPGIEIYFKDSICPIIVGSDAERCRYFTATIHCCDQEAYQELCRIVSREDFPTTEIYEENQQLWDWKTLEHIAKFNVTLTLGGVHDIVGKVALASQSELADKVFLKLKNVFQEKLYISIICETWTKKWNSVVEIELTDGTKVSCLANDSVSTDRARRIKALDLTEREGHKVLKSFSSGGLSREVNLGIKSVKLHKGFLPLPGGDALLKVNQFLWTTAFKYNVPVILSDYAYYAEKEDKIVQTMRLEGTNKLQPNFYMKSEEEVVKYLKETLNLIPDHIKCLFETLDSWCSKFDKLELKYDWHLPDSGGIPIQQAMQIIKQNSRMKWDDPAYVDRLREEIEVISKNGVKDLMGYFLPICDVMTFHKENGKLTGPARGSSAGSLLCYLLGITQVDSIKAELSFPRFLSLDRIKNGDYPDVDSDYSTREMLVGKDGKSGYLYGRWGNKAAQISTRHTLRLKSTVKDVNRYLKGKVEPEIETFTKALPDTPQGVTDAEFVFGYEDKEGEHHTGLVEIDEALQKYIEKRPEEWEIVKKSLGLTRAHSRHASAFVIADVPIKDVVPTKEGNITQYEAKAVEAARLLKYDFLTVSNILDIEVCLNLINKKNNETNTIGNFTHNGEQLYIWNLPEDPDVFKSVWAGNTETIFQINTKSMIPFVKDILPQSKEDLSIIGAIVRPGTLDYIDKNTGRNMAQEYVCRRNGTSEPDLKELYDLIPETYGVLCIKEGSRVKTNNGLVEIEKIKVGDLVQTENGSYQQVLNNIYKGKSKTIRIRTDNAEELEVTPDHKILTARGWIEAKYLTNRDLIKHFWVSDEKIEEGTELDWLVGLILADGSVTKSPVICAGNVKERAIEIKKIADKVFNIDSRVYWHCRSWYVALTRRPNQVKKTKSPIVEYLKSIDIWGHNSFNKIFPQKVTKMMIQGFIEGDGCLANKRIRIKNESMAKTIFETLQALRIKSCRSKYEFGVDVISFETSSFKWKLKYDENTSSDKGVFYPKPKWKLPRSDGDRQNFGPKMMKRAPFISSYVLDRIGKKYGFEIDKSSTWSKVISINSNSQAESKVYDLMIENVHSFVVGGCVVHNCYQEQSLKISKELGGMTPSDAEKLRRLFSKKLKKEAGDMKPIFMNTAIPKIGEEKANKIWDMMEASSRYSFNKSHSYSYGLITYACMFLRHYYPLEWWAAILTNATEQEITGKLWPYVKEFIYPPDINLSTDTMVVDYANGKIRSKFGVIHGIGEATIGPIVAGRPYDNIQSFVDKEVAGPSLSHKLIHVGVLDSLFPPRTNLLEKLKLYQDAVERKNFSNKLHKSELSGKKMRATQAKEGAIPQEYVGLHPIKDAAMRKNVLPSLYVNTTDLGRKYSKASANDPGGDYVVNGRGYKTLLIDGERLKRLDEMDGEGISKDIYVAATSFIVKSEEFAYPKNNPGKRALKLIIDVDGHTLQEKVMWPDFNSGELIYPKECVRGSICTIFFRKRQGRKDMNVTDIIVESD